MKHNGSTVECKTGCGDLYCTLNKSGKKFLGRIGKPGTCGRAQVSAQSELIELALNHGATIDEVVECMSGIKCHHSNEAMGMRSCPDAFAHCLKELQKLAPETP